MTDSSVTWLRSSYSDSDALNDIHALLTGTNSGTDREQLSDIGMILTRTRRAMVPVRHIDATVTETSHGRPVARVDADGVCVTVRQEPAGSGLLIEISSAAQASACGDTTVTFDGRCLHHSCPSSGHLA